MKLYFISQQSSKSTLPFAGLQYTVKPELTATSEQRSPANNGQPKPDKSNSIAILIENPLNSGAATCLLRPVFWGPKGGRCRHV